MNARQKCKQLKNKIRYSNNCNTYKVTKTFSKKFKDSINLSEEAQDMYIRQLIIDDFFK
jgi:hypothetical protein